jgi:hypothetical protein
MTTPRLPASDPRTIARDIPGVLDGLFPQLVPGIVAHFNRRSLADPRCKAVAKELVAASSMQRAMLFELAVAVGERLAEGDSFNWETCLNVAIVRQRRHFDAQIPAALSDADRVAALAVAENLATMLETVRADAGDAPLLSSPRIPGYQWIASGVGDFSAGPSLIEVKCTRKHFSASDYRQILMYWLLGYAGSMEGDSTDWTDGILLNPRLNLVLRLPFDEIVAVTAAGRSKVELLELFSSMVSNRNPEQ